MSGFSHGGATYILSFALYDTLTFGAICPIYESDVVPPVLDDPLYAAHRLGLAACVKNAAERPPGRALIGFRQFTEVYAAAWQVAAWKGVRVSVIGRVIGGILRPILERQAKGRSVQEFAGSLERSGEEVAKRLQNAPDIPHNREVANHIVGIERWGQRRLRVALGEPPVEDSYRGYRLPEGVDLEALYSAFTDTRRDTVELARKLSFTDPKPQTKVRHNDLGELSVGGWLAYLEGHAKRESTRIKGGHG